MKEIWDRKRLIGYLQAHKLRDIFTQEIMPQLSLYEFEQGEFICSQGESSRYLYVLVKGKIKIYTTSAEGKTLVISFKTPLDTIGDIEYVQKIDIINTVEAVSPVTMIRVSYGSLDRHVGDHSPFLRFLLDIITRKFFMKSTFMSFNLMYPVEVRLASYLLSVSFDENDIRFRGKLDTSGLKDAANLLGTSYRHLNRVLQKFSAEGWIERSKDYILVTNEKALRELASPNLYE